MLGSSTLNPCVYFCVSIYHILYIYIYLSPTSVGYAWVLSLQFTFASGHFPNRVGLDVELELQYVITESRATLGSFPSSILFFRGVSQTGLALMFSWSFLFVVAEAIPCVMTGTRWPSVGRIGLRSVLSHTCMHIFISCILSC